MISPQGTKQHIVNGRVRFIPGIVVAVILSHEVNEACWEDFHPLPAKFDVEFVLFPKDPLVTLSVECCYGRMVTHLGEEGGREGREVEKAGGREGGRERREKRESDKV